MVIVTVFGHSRGCHSTVSNYFWIHSGTFFNIVACIVYVLADISHSFLISRAEREGMPSLRLQQHLARQPRTEPTQRQPERRRDWQTAQGTFHIWCQQWVPKQGLDLRYPQGTNWKGEIFWVNGLLRFQITWTSLKHQDFGCSHKVAFLAFLALKVALKVNYDLEFEIGGLCSLCKPILSYVYSCLGHVWQLS